MKIGLSIYHWLTNIKNTYEILRTYVEMDYNLSAHKKSQYEIKR